MKLSTGLALLPLLCCLAARGAETNEALTVESIGEGKMVFDLRTGVATYKDGVMLKYGPSVLTADTMQIDRETGETFAKGNVILQREGGQLWRGEQLNYNFKTRVISGNNYLAGHPPYFISGETLITEPTNQTYITTNGYFSTDDHPDPGYRIRAKKIIIVPGKSIEARDAVVYLGDVPVMYLPYYHKELTRHENNYTFLTGYRSTWGPFLLNTYNWHWSDAFQSALNFDLRGTRRTTNNCYRIFGLRNFNSHSLQFIKTSLESISFFHS